MKRILILLFLSCFALSQSSLELIESLPEELKNEILDGEIEEVDQISIEDNLTSNNDQETVESIDESIDESIEPFFGYTFFESANITSTPILDIPLQGNYKLNFNDQLELLLTGNKQKLIKLRVDMSGNVLIPEVGPVSLVNLDLEQANSKIQILINQSYVGTQSYLSVSEASLKKISIIGAVKNPGTYLVNPFISLTEAIKYAGGLVENSSLRKIKIIDSKDNLQEIDLYDFLVFGKRKNDISLQNGDTVLIPATSNFVSITGEVLRPLTYEFLSSDRVEDLIEFAMGTNNFANSKNISAYFVSNEAELSKIVKIKDFVENNIQELNIGKLVSIPQRSARIYGDSVRSGSYEVTRGEPLSKLINRLRFSGEIYPFYFLLKQSDNSGLVKEYFNLSLSDQSTYENITLKDNVEVHFFTTSDFTESKTDITEEMEDIFKDIPQTYFKDFNIGSVTYNLPFAGKFSPEKVNNFLGVNQQINPDQTIIKTVDGIELNSYETIVDANNIISVTIPAITVEKFSVEIRGQVNSPGIYVVDSTSTLAELYKMSGNLKPTAFTKGVFFSRESIKDRERNALDSAKSILYNSLFSASNLTGQAQQQIDIEGLLQFSDTLEVTGRISGNFDVDSDEVNSLFLEEDDYIYVPYLPTTITVFGEVLNPITTSFQYNLSYSDYISLAGGYTKNADKNSIYVIRANGESVPLNSGAFQKEIYLEPGDTLIIPRDLDKISALPLVSIATKIISDLAFAAAALNALSNWKIFP